MEYKKNDNVLCIKNSKHIRSLEQNTVDLVHSYLSTRIPDRKHFQFMETTAKKYMKKYGLDIETMFHNMENSVSSSLDITLYELSRQYNEKWQVKR